MALFNTIIRFAEIRKGQRFLRLLPLQGKLSFIILKKHEKPSQNHQKGACLRFLAVRARRGHGPPLAGTDARMSAPRGLPMPGLPPVSKTGPQAPVRMISGWQGWTWALKYVLIKASVTPPFLTGCQGGAQRGVRSNPESGKGAGFFARHVDLPQKEPPYGHHQA
ncbi:MAG: hypothetical protein J1E80_03080 [Desulfovibrionaceae bacterium]|nr:hypothetical protein [Desulfovibrionaceae bacterium]